MFYTTVLVLFYNFAILTLSYNFAITILSYDLAIPTSIPWLRCVYTTMPIFVLLSYYVAFFWLGSFDMVSYWYGYWLGSGYLQSVMRQEYRDVLLVAGPQMYCWGCCWFDLQVKWICWRLWPENIMIDLHDDLVQILYACMWLLIRD